MRIPSLTIAAVALLTLACSGCKTETVTPPGPTAIINNTRDRLTPFRFTLTTDPTSPSVNRPVLLKVHVIDAVDQPADGVTLQADVLMAGMDQGAQHLTLSGKGGGDYEGQVKLEMAGSWDVGLTATRDGKSRQQKLSIEVGG
jgi:YtkA-like